MRRRVASVVEKTEGGDVQQIKDIIAKYKPIYMQGILSEGKQSLNEQQEFSSQDTEPNGFKAGMQSQNLLHTFN